MRRYILKIIVLMISTLLLIGCKKEPVVEENVLTFYDMPETLNSIILDGVSISLHGNAPSDLIDMGYNSGSLDTQTTIALGYNTSDLDHLYYSLNESTNKVNCVSAASSNGFNIVELNFKRITPNKVGFDNSNTQIIANDGFSWGEITRTSRATEIIEILGEPTESEKSETGDYSKLVYQINDIDGKIKSKVVIDIVGRELWNIQFLNKE